MVNDILAGIVGALTGILSGMGIGGGTLLILYLTAVWDVAPTAAAGINLLYFLGCAPSALVVHIREHRVVWRAAIWASVGGGVTALISAFLAPDPTPDLLRRLFGILLLGIGVRELWQAFYDEKKSG